MAERPVLFGVISGDLCSLISVLPWAKGASAEVCTTTAFRLPHTREAGFHPPQADFTEKALAEARAFSMG